MNTKDQQKSGGVTFEEAMRELEEVTRQLEDGELGLGDALACYERGVGLLKQCHGMLRQAEQKVTLITEIAEDGTAVSEPFEAETPVEPPRGDVAKRSRASSTPGSQSAVSDPVEPQRVEQHSEPRPAETEMDTQKGLF